MRLNIVTNGLWTKIIHKPLCKIHTSHIIYVKTGAVLVGFFQLGDERPQNVRRCFAKNRGRKALLQNNWCREGCGVRSGFRITVMRVRDV